MHRTHTPPPPGKEIASAYATVRAQNLVNKTAAQGARHSAATDNNQESSLPVSRRRGAVDEVSRARNERDLRLFFFPEEAAT